MLEKYKNKIILFDIGNVIFRFENLKKIYDIFNIKAPYEELDEIWENIKCNGTEMGKIADEEYIKVFIEKMKLDIDINEYKKIYSEMFIDKGIKDTIDFIYLLKRNNIKIGVLSNLSETDKNMIEEYIISLDIFDYKFLSFEMKMMKPDINIYKEVIRVCDTKPEDIIFFDDRQENIEVALKCGIQAYQVDTNNVNETWNMFIDNI